MFCNNACDGRDIHVCLWQPASGEEGKDGRAAHRCVREITALFDHRSVCLSVCGCTLRSGLLESSQICPSAICAALIWPWCTTLPLWRPGLLHYADKSAPAWPTLCVCVCVCLRGCITEMAKNSNLCLTIIKSHYVSVFVDIKTLIDDQSKKRWFISTLLK